MSWQLKTMFIKHPSQPVLFSFSSASSLMQVPETRSNIKQLHTVTTTTSWKHSLDHVHPVPAPLPVLLVQTALSPGISFLALCELFFLYLDLFACVMCNSSTNPTFTFPSGSSDGSLTYKLLSFLSFKRMKSVRSSEWGESPGSSPWPQQPRTLAELPTKTPDFLWPIQTMCRSLTCPPSPQPRLDINFTQRQTSSPCVLAKL